jgi:large subunit ribosomal protein L18
MAGNKKISSVRRRGRLRRKASIRKRVAGTSERPRLTVFRSIKHVYAQAIDDVAQKVVATASDLDPDIRGELGGLKKKDRAKKVGLAIGQRLKQKNVTRVVFDRNGFHFHGRIKELATGAREAGLEF